MSNDKKTSEQKHLKIEIIRQFWWQSFPAFAGFQFYSISQVSKSHKHSLPILLTTELNKKRR